MTASVVTWSQDMSSLGSAAVAIGVFDGVHVGHQALLRDTVDDARARNILAVAVTFDRDPDQIVSAGSAAPQLLTLADKLDCIAETGVDDILVVPFTPVLAEMAPESFVDSVLLASMRPVSVHVGRDFRFGARATGNVDTLQRLGLSYSFEVWPYNLIEVDGSPVTSTRIRALVAAGNVAAAADLLCRRPRVTGTVRRGRGEGVTLGFPTANIEPVPFAALPADGVYAGRAILEDGIEWAAAISVGTPPMFPEARDYLEAHLVDFEGDLYGQSVTLEFWEKLRDLQSYPSLEALTEAIAADVDAALDVAGFPDAPDDEDTDDDEFDYEAEDISDEDLVEDPEALAAAEAKAAAFDSADAIEDEHGAWAPLLTHIELPRGPASAALGFAITAPLDSEGIPYVWDPCTPGSIVPGGLGAYAGDYALYVPESRFAEAAAALEEAGETDRGTLEPEAIPIEDAEAIEDPAALAAAEEAVRAPSPELPHDDDDEIVVLADKLPYDGPRLSAISAALVAAGVDAIWSPYPPEEAPLLRLGILHANRFRIEVWNSQLELARAALQDADRAE